MSVYYNEHDKHAAAWLQQLCDDFVIPAGRVDSRDIQDITADELKPYDTCHFFAGIGGWAYALDLAGWSGPVWTASLPCQPFSAAGKQLGSDDHRHLWPVFHDLVAQRKPPVLVGEQVASKPGRAWFAAVQADLENLGYRVAGFDLSAACVGAPHIRQRLYWGAVRVADAASSAAWQRGVGEREESPWSPHRHDDDGCAGGLANSQCSGLERLARAGDDRNQPRRQREEASRPVAESGWDNAVFTPCADGKARPIEPGLEPLALRIPGRVGLLRGYGNAIVPQVAAEFLRAFSETLETY
jgi:DNA (cytosine-5)-methyltransferase 1